MDPVRFDSLARTLSSTGTRRTVLRLLAALPLAGGLLPLLAQEPAAAKKAKSKSKSKNTNANGVSGGDSSSTGTSTNTTTNTNTNESTNTNANTGTNTNTNTGTNTGTNTSTNTSTNTDPGCTPTTCAAQGKQCGASSDGCNQTLDCGSCRRTTPICISTNTCVACSPANPCPTGGCCQPDGACLANGAACDDGDPCTTGTICTNGTCGGGMPVSCTTPPECHTTVDATCSGGTCTYPALAAGTPCDTVPCGQCDAMGQCGGCPACRTCDGTSGMCVVDASQDGQCCAGPTGGKWCQSGACVAVPASGTIQQCQGACALSRTQQRAVHVCGATMTCPACGDACTGVAPCDGPCISVVGPFDTGLYCIRFLLPVTSCVSAPCPGTAQCCQHSTCVELCIP